MTVTPSVALFRSSWLVAFPWMILSLGQSDASNLGQLLRRATVSNLGASCLIRNLPTEPLAPMSKIFSACSILLIIVMTRIFCSQINMAQARNFKIWILSEKIKWFEFFYKKRKVQLIFFEAGNAAKTFIFSCKSLIFLSSIIIPKLIAYIQINKIMSRNITDPPGLKHRIQDIHVNISPSKIQIYRPINPQLTPLRQNKSDIYRYAEREEVIISPFQKDQFLNQFDSATSQKKFYGDGELPYWRSMTRQQNRTKITGTIPQVLKMQDVLTPKEVLSKSWTNHVEHRQTVTYLEQIINDLCDKQQFELTRRYIQKLHNPHLRQKLEGVVAKLQNRDMTKTMNFVHIRQMLIKLLKTYFRYEKGIELASVQRMLKELQKSIARQMKDDHRILRRESQEKVKQLREESKMLNSRLQRQTKQFYKALQQEKSKMKESYEQIYRLIYEENNKLKKEFENKEAGLRQERAQSEAIKNKYQVIFNEISSQLRDIKQEYSKLVDASGKQTEKNKNLTEEIRFVTQKLKMEEGKVRQMDLQLQNIAKKYQLLEDEKTKLEYVSLKYKDYAEKFLGETKKYQNERLQKEKIQNQLKNARDLQMKKKEQQELYNNDLQANIRKNQEIVCNQLKKIQQNYFILQQKAKIIQALKNQLHQIEAQLISCSKNIKQLRQQQLIYQQQNALLNQESKNRQQELTKMQQKPAIIEKLISNQEQKFIQLTQQSKNKETIKQKSQREIVKINQQINNQKQKLLAIKKQYQSLQSQRSLYAAEICQKNEQVQDKNKQIIVFNSQIQHKKSQLSSLQRQIRTIQQNIHNFQTQKQHSMLQEQSNLNKIISDKQHIIQDLNKQIQQTRLKLSQSIQQLASIQKNIDQTNKYHNQLQQKVAGSVQELACVQQLLSNKNYLMQSIQNKLIQLQSNIEMLQRSNGHMYRHETLVNYRNQQLEVSLKMEQMKDLEANVTALQLQRVSIKQSIQSLKCQQTKASQQLDSLKEALKIHQDEIAKKKKEKDAVECTLQLKYEELINLESDIMIKKSINLT